MTRQDALDAATCLAIAKPGDTCVYLSGNYGSIDFEPKTSGEAGRRIVHRCEKLHGCIFDRLQFQNVSYLDVMNFASDSHYYDRSKSFVNPRVEFYGSHHIMLDSVRVRGEPVLCAPDTPPSGCRGTEFNRYNDLVRIGKARSEGSTSYAIEITGRSMFENANHTVFQFHDDNDLNFCRPKESDIWVHGTEDAPIVVRTIYKHLVAFKGACRILMEYIDFGPAGTGRGDLTQPNYSDTGQVGGILHGETIQNVIVRFSNFSGGGSGTEDAKNMTHIEVGAFGQEVNGACFAHNSHYRPWGTVAVLGRIDANQVRSVRNVSIINNAVQEGWYLAQSNSRRADSRYFGYLFAQIGQENNVSIDVDGIVADRQSSSNGILYTGSTAGIDTDSLPITHGGITLGKKVSRVSGVLFRDPASWDFRPQAGSPLVQTAVPIARTTGAGNGSQVPVDRPECFAGTMAGMRKGDDVDIGGQLCTIQTTDLSNGTVTCSQSLSWNSGDPIYYRLNGRAFTDIGSRSPDSAKRIPIDDDRNKPKPPMLLDSN